MKQTFTKSVKASDITHEWVLVDVKDQILGRAATVVAQKLMGKSKPYFVRNMDCGNYVVVINAATVKTTGRKEKKKLYGNYSGEPGGLKQKALWQVRKEKPTEPMRRAVMGMLPKNKLRNRLITRLFVYPDAEHQYQEKFQNNKNPWSGLIYFTCTFPGQAYCVKFNNRHGICLIHNLSFNHI